MSATGRPTRYSTLSDGELNAVFASDSWSRSAMGLHEKLEAVTTGLCADPQTRR